MKRMENRDGLGKLFWVSTSSTTTTLETTTQCVKTSAAAACGKKKRKRSIVTHLPAEDMEDILPSRRSQDEFVEEVEIFWRQNPSYPGIECQGSSSTGRPPRTHQRPRRTRPHLLLLQQLALQADLHCHPARDLSICFDCSPSLNLPLHLFVWPLQILSC